MSAINQSTSSILQNTTTANLTLPPESRAQRCISVKVAAIALPLSTITSIIGHTIILRSISKHGLTKNSFYVFLVNLSAANLLLCFSMVALVVLDKFFHRQEYCLMPGIVLMRSSIFAMGVFNVLLCINRFVAIKVPLSIDILTKQKLLSGVCLVWVICVCPFVFTVEHDKKPFIKRPAQNIILSVVSLSSLIIDTTLILAAQNEGRTRLVELRARTTYLYGKNAEQHAVLLKRLRKNKEVGLLLVSSHFLALPYYVICTMLSALTFSDQSWQCLAFLASFDFNIITALHPIIYIYSTHDLHKYVKRDFKNFRNKLGINSI